MGQILYSPFAERSHSDRHSYTRVFSFVFGYSALGYYHSGRRWTQKFAGTCHGVLANAALQFISCATSIGRQRGCTGARLDQGGGWSGGRWKFGELPSILRAGARTGISGHLGYTVRLQALLVIPSLYKMLHPQITTEFHCSVYGINFLKSGRRAQQS